ncbi:MAG: hypothetical protein QOF48_2075 [Verrucomicrobiota bacterium]|jgi:molybdopterin-containing oxidoreductase family iron-sulfur binding subunit
MKTIPPSCPEPESGQRYWRSLDQLAEAPEFRQWVEREFPAGASELVDPVSRRHFVKLMSASFALGGLGILGAGCRRPEEKILPFGKAAEGYIHGVPQFFATAMPTRGSAIPLLVKSSDGRPTKIEGNPEHPDSNGATDTFAQASILGLYDPDRAKNFVQKGITISREMALDALGNFGKGFVNTRGARLAFLMEQSSSPSRRRLALTMQLKFPEAKWAVYEPLDLHANRRVTGSIPHFKLDQAKVILSLDCDFIGTESDSHCLIRGFARGRRVEKPTDSMNRLYAVEGLMTLTGMNADHRLRVATSHVVAVAAAIAAKIAPQNTQITALVAQTILPSNVKPEWIAECAKDLQANAGASLVLAGHRQPLAVHVIANLLNAALGNVGKTVQYAAVPETTTNSDIAGLVALLNAGQIDTLVILGGNPAYNAPAELKWAQAQSKAKDVVRLGAYEDETFGASAQTTATQTFLQLPQAHYLESWGDAVTRDGTTVPIQPLIAPLFDGLNELEVLARLGDMEINKPHEIVRETFRAAAGTGVFEENWKKFLHDGFLAGAKPGAADRPLSAGEVTQAFASISTPALSKDNLEIVFHRDSRLDDGRWSNNGWLQEFPDPVTKATWDCLILISRKTAAELGVDSTTTNRTTSDLVRLTVTVGGETKSIVGPVWITPGMADNSLGLALGYGRKRSKTGGTGRIGQGVGLYNAYEIRSSSTMNFATGAKLERLGERYNLAVTQEHGSMEGRPIIREANKAQYEKQPAFAKNFDLEAHMEFIPKDEKGRPKGIYEHPYHAYETRKSMNGVSLEGLHMKSDIHQWGMSVDLNQCVGCGACVLACQSENNVPIVGKDQVSRNREMHWLRIDRYFSGAGDKLDAMVDDPQAVHQPMMCQHCENAPCESVCPVNATVHDEEGLNVMAYNRCVGTRYCSNNCAYKVRRFNFLDFNRRSLDQLKGPFYSSPLVGSTEGEWTMKRWWKNPDGAIRPQDEWDILKLVKNPDVTVRMRGVMEKCTLCVQRIEQGKIAQKVKAGQSGDVRVADGAIKTACQQACPAEAIVFGNQLDPNSRVSLLQKSDRNYEVLGFLETRPRVTYLARIRNPNPKMPDYYEIPLNTGEYVKKQTANPYEPHQAHGEGGGEAGGHGAEKKGAH